MSQNMLDYSPPAWIISGSKLADIALSDSADAKITWRLDEIKAGVLICEHNLNIIPLTLFGRVLPESDLPDDTRFIITAHESCSRLHARIAFDQTGSPWLRDLGSNHGTFVNKKKLPLKSIGRNENGTGEGSRGVRIYPGDVIQFAASTRCFIVEGPPKYDRNNAKIATSNNTSHHPLAPENIIQQVKSSNTEMVVVEHGVSWGMDMEGIDPEQVQDDDLDLSLLDSSTIPEKHRKLYEKINEKKYKLTNIQEEIQRIQKKETFSTLSDGQVTQIAKNQSKEQDLLREIQELEFDLISKLKGDNKNTAITGSSIRKRRRMKDEDDAEEEESAFYDRTWNRVNSSLNERKGIDSSGSEVVAETEQSLKDKWVKLFSLFEKRRRDTERLLSLVQDVEKEIQEYSMKNQEGLSDEDLFFLNNDLTVAKDRWRLAMESESIVEKELSSVESLLHVIDKDYICDKNTGFVGTKRDLSTAPQLFRSKSDPPSSAEVKTSKDPISFNSSNMDDDYKQEEMTSSKVDMAYATRGTAVPDKCYQQNHDHREQSQGSSIPSRDKKDPKPSTNQGIYSFIALHQNKDKKTLNKSLPLGDSLNNNNLNKEKDSELRNEWVAPEDQDGTGFTKLNEKYLGRY